VYLADHKFMSGFGLHAVGDFFDVDCYLRQHNVDHDSVWHRGENFYTHSGFEKKFGNELEIDDREQELIAIKYLQRHRDALKALVNWENVESVVLGISPSIPIAPNVVSVCLCFSHDLVSLSEEIGLKLAFYVRPVMDDGYEIKKIGKSCGLS
jgi:hypothetical protein